MPLIPPARGTALVRTISRLAIAKKLLSDQRASKIALEPGPQKSITGCSRRAPLQDYLAANFRGGPGAMVLDRQISALTGKNIDKLSGSHDLDSIEIR